VLPYMDAGEAAASGNPWLLKLHGCVSHPEDIVLTRYINGVVLSVVAYVVPVVVV